MNQATTEESEATLTEVGQTASDDQDREEATEGDISAEEKKYRRGILWKQRVFKWTDEAANSAGYAVWVIAAFVAILFLVPYALNLQITVVLTESMSGTIEKGDVVLTQPFEPAHDKLEVGDVALFTNSSGAQFLHRVQAVNADGTYTMRGDANDAADFFKPSNEDVKGVLFNTVHQPQAGMLSLFSLNFEWFGVFWAAIVGGQWAVAGGLLPLAPWGFLILAFSALLFWVVIPRVLHAIVNRANLRAAVELDHLKRAVAAHEDAITEHGESIEEIEPVVDELKNDHEAAKAEKAAEFQHQVASQEAFWDAVADFDPESMYDPDPFAEPMPKEEVTDATGEPEFPPTRNPFEQLRERQAAEKAAQEAVARDLSEFRAPDESTSTVPARPQRLANSAFYFGEDD